MLNMVRIRKLIIALAVLCSVNIHAATEEYPFGKEIIDHLTIYKGHIMGFSSEETFVKLNQFGHKEWEIEIPKKGVKQLGLKFNRLFFLYEDGEIQCFDITIGAKVWESKDLKVTQVKFHYPYCFYQSGERTLGSFDYKTGQKIWEKKFKNPIKNMLTLQNKNTMLVQVKNGWKKVNVGTGESNKGFLKELGASRVEGMWGNFVLEKGKKVMSIYNLLSEKKTSLKKDYPDVMKLYDGFASIMLGENRKEISKVNLRNEKVEWEIQLEEEKKDIIWGDAMICLIGDKVVVIDQKKGNQIIEELEVEGSIKGLIEGKGKIGLVTEEKVIYVSQL